MNTGNGGPTRQDSYFLSPFMPKTAEMALPLPTKTFLPRSPDTAMLFQFAPSGCTHPSPPVPPFLLSQNLQGHCRKSHDEAESIMTTFGAMGPKGLMSGHGEVLNNSSTSVCRHFNGTIPLKLTNTPRLGQDTAMASYFSTSVSNPY